MEKLKYISLFSGIEAASVAWDPLGWEPIAFSEIEPFPCALLNQRFHQVPNLGDITKIDWSSYREKADIIVGGSPCQSFSIAGNREGLKGESGLMFEYIRAVREVMPRYFVWENVPGALSSEKGAAFGQLLHEMDVIGYGLAWRVLDAQFFGVAQRRRRVFLVGCLGNAGRAAQILFDGESMCWNYPSSRNKRKSLAERIKGRIGSCYSMLVRCGCAGGKGALVQDDVSATLSTSNTQTIFQPAPQCAYLPFNPTQVTSKQNGNNPQWDDPCHTLAATDRPPHVVAFRQNASGDVIIHGGDGQTTGALTANSTVSRRYNVVCMADANAKAAIDEDLSGTLKVGGEPPIAAIENRPHYVVRKLMPLECERLQGFPDGWTDIDFKGKQASDAARYKALGNSMAVPVMHWIGNRIARFEA